MQTANARTSLGKHLGVNKLDVPRRAGPMSTKTDEWRHEEV